MSAPLTQTQLPNEAILDQFNKQTYLGNSFILPQSGKALTDTSEHAILVITNPSGSGKSLFLNRIQLVSDLNPTLIRVYANSTINVAGSATAAVNLRTGATTTSISLNYLGASFTANGTLMGTFPCTTTSFWLNLLFVIDQGKNILITGQQVSGSAGTSNIFAACSWYEI